jgi:hypothetical protein
MDITRFHQQSGNIYGTGIMESKFADGNLSCDTIFEFGKKILSCMERKIAIFQHVAKEPSN